MPAESRSINVIPNYSDAALARSRSPGGDERETAVAKTINRADLAEARLGDPVSRSHISEIVPHPEALRLLVMRDDRLQQPRVDAVSPPRGRCEEIP
jgi:hypothetical protein